VAFDRFLARLFSKPIKGLIVKGGYTLELRLKRARTTRDIDFSFTGDLGGLWRGKAENLQEFLYVNAQVDVGDFFEFVIGTAILDLENAPYGGFRYPIESRMAGRVFAKFSIDIAAGDAWHEPHENIQTHDWFDFAGIPPIAIPVISAEQQFAEKLHAFTLLRDYPNSRVKDIIDMVLLINETHMSASELFEITQATFLKRANSEFPPLFSAPPDTWKKPYSKLAQSCAIEGSLEEATTLVRSYCKEIGIIQ
jgi:hypothetical protein